jgi:hypothetical protein
MRSHRCSETAARSARLQIGHKDVKTVYFRRARVSEGDRIGSTLARLYGLFNKGGEMQAAILPQNVVGVLTIIIDFFGSLQHATLEAGSLAQATVLYRAYKPERGGKKVGYAYDGKL